MIINLIILGTLLFTAVSYIFLLKIFGFKKRKEWLYLIQHFTFFLGFFLISDLNYDFLISAFELSIPDHTWLILFATTNIYSAIFFIPTSIFSAFIRSRKNIFFIAYGLFGIAAILTLVHPSLTTVLISIVLCGMALSSNSLWYVSFNEDKLNNSRPFYAIGFLMPMFFLSNMIAINMQQLIGIQGNSKIFIGIACGVIAISIAMNFLLKENKEHVGAFNFEIRKNLEPFKWIKVVSILFLLVLISTISTVGQGDFYRLFINQLTYDQDLSSLNNYRQYLFMLGEAIGAFISCRLFVNNFSFKHSITISFAVIGLYFLTIPWITSSLVIIILSFIFGIAVATVFCILLSLILSYNARIIFRPITGMFSAVNALTIGLSDFIQRIILIHNFGPTILNDWHVVDGTQEVKNIFLYISLGLTLLSVIGILYNNIRAKSFMGEYYWTHKNNQWLVNFDNLIQLNQVSINYKLIDFKTKKGEYDDKC